jgi:hypothetical protein
MIFFFHGKAASFFGTLILVRRGLGGSVLDAWADQSTTGTYGILLTARPETSSEMAATELGADFQFRF